MKTNWKQKFYACMIAITIPISGMGCAMALQELPVKDYQGNLKRDEKGNPIIGGRILKRGIFTPELVELYNHEPIKETHKIETTKVIPPQQTVQQTILPGTIPVEWKYTGCKGEEKKKIVQAKVPEEYRKTQPPTPDKPVTVIEKQEITIIRTGDTKVVSGPSKATQVAALFGATGEVMTGIGAINLGRAAMGGKLASGGQTNVNYAEGGQGGNVESGAVINAPNMIQNQKFSSEIGIDISQKVATTPSQPSKKGSHHNHGCSPK